MAQQKKIQTIQQFKRTNRDKVSKARQQREPSTHNHIHSNSNLNYATVNGNSNANQKCRLHGLRKQVFLTDTQTSDYTKSSGQMRVMKIQKLEIALRSLQKQNQQLKHTVINMKANQFYQLNQEKLKDLIRQNQKLKSQCLQSKKQIENLLIQRDFLKRFNKNLKAECQALMREILSLKNPHVSSLSIPNSNNVSGNFYNLSNNTITSTNENKKIQKSINNSSSQELYKNSHYRRSTSAQFMLIGKKSYKIYESEKVKKLKQSSTNYPTKNSVNAPGSGVITAVAKSPEATALNSDYFHGSFNTQNKNKIFKLALS